MAHVAATTPRPPLGIPRGSVRALLTIMIVAVVILHVVRGEKADFLWAETLMLALAHYFSSRRFVELPSEVIAKLEKEGHIIQESNPLWLPRSTIRLLIVGAFLIAGAYVYRERGQFDLHAFSVLEMVFAYFLGTFFRAIFRSKRNTKPHEFWEDLKALAVLGLVAITAGAELVGQNNLVPEQMRVAALSLVLFYFGSR